ncbi:MAG: choice-of-anchor J domain-containing protein, partial [Candidatus Marinimicrobia bacterium]|nr:choice-of-anchor J domain-containing protein [Candidatus Neomarinimicrobiota bacterium]
MDRESIFTTLRTGISLLLAMSIATAATPDAVTLDSPAFAPNHSLDLSWSESADSAFKAYRLYRSGTSGVDTTADLIAVISDSSTLSYTDSTTRLLTTYYYKIFVADTLDTLSSGSNEVSATTFDNDYPLIDDLESGDLDWFVPTGTWAISDEDAYSGTHSWSDSPNGAYASSENNALITAISLTSPDVNMPALTFYHRYNFEPDNDHGLVEVSTNGGSSYTYLYDITGYSGSYWKYESIDLATYWGQEIYVRFRVVSNGSVQSDGWHIDDIRIDATPKATAIPFPFTDDFNDEARSDSLWLTSSWGTYLGPADSRYDGTPYMHSRPNGNYYAGTHASLVSAQIIDLTDAVSPILTFQHRRVSSGGYYQTDDFRVLVSTDNGITYTTMATYDNSSASWTRSQVNLSAYAGVPIRLRFHVNGQGSVAYWAIENVNVAESPLDVVLDTPTPVGQHAVQLSWSASIAGDFSSYRIYRSTTSGVNGSQLITITDVATTTFIDSSMLDYDRYYYKIFVVDTLSGYSTGSNQESIEVPSVAMNSYPFFDDMESGPGNFADDRPWAVTDEDAYSGTHSWSDSPGGAYGSNTSRSLYLPIDLTSPDVNMPALTFYHRYNFEPDNDHGLVEVSTNGGSSYTYLYD